MNIRRICKILIYFYLSYLALVFIAVNPFLNYYAGVVYEQQTGRQLQYDKVGIDPFAVTLYAYQVSDRDSDGEKLWSFETFELDLSIASLWSDGIVLDYLLVDSLYVHPRKLKNGEHSWQDIIDHRVAMPVAAEDKPEKTEQALPGLTIHRLQLSVDYMGYSDFSRSEPFIAFLKNINLSLQDFSTLIAEGKPYRLVAQGEAGGEVEWEGTVSVLGKESRGSLELRGISLLPGWRFMKEDVNFNLDSAFFTVGGDYVFSWQDIVSPHYEISNGFARLFDYSMVARNDPGSYLSWQEIHVQDIAVNSRAQNAVIDQVTIYDLAGRLQINEDGSTNFHRMFAYSPAPKSDAPQIATPQTTTPQPATAGTQTQEALPWQVDLNKVVFVNNTLDFSDLSLNTRFRVQVEELGGEITGISSSPDAQAAVNLSGKVDGYAPVSILGTVAPLSDPVQLDLDLNFYHIDLSTISPYSGTYAGWKIEQGLLTVNLGYELQNNYIVGSNKVVVDQLKLGERVESYRLVDVPLRLAVALLTDENGTMNLDVPIEGDVNDPGFKLSGVIWQGVRNLVVKLVTAPFKALGSLFESKHDLEYVPFDIGSESLTEVGREVLDDVKKGLDKRPILRLGVVGRYDAAKDTLHMQQQQFEQSLLAAGLQQADIDNRTPAWQAQINSLFAASFPAKLDVPAGQEPDFDKKNRMLVSAIEIDKKQLEGLARQRALSVKRYLISEQGLAPDKVFLKEEGVVDDSTDVKLLLDAG